MFLYIVPFVLAFCQVVVTRRRTNPVKEVEKLEKNREERRIRNAETREERKTMMRRDPGNANWEFSAMIKYHIND